MPIISFKNVWKYYEKDKPVLKDLSVEIESGEFVTLIGPSGCGKTTFLKLINGLLQQEKGYIRIKGRKVTDWKNIELKRSIGYVIQQVGLFPHMTVRDNISYVLNIMNSEKTLQKERASELIELVDMDQSYLDRYPRELSGGQSQRVGVARALAADPDIILMDEPFGAVDEISREVLQSEIQKIYKLLGKTIVFVTHDIAEAMKLGTRIILFDEGRIVQSGTKEEMLFHPKSEFVENFFGIKNFSAFLNVEKIEKVYTALDGNEPASYIQDNIPSVFTGDSIMSGVKCIFDCGVEILAVKDSSGSVVGKFSLKDIRENAIQ